MDGPETFKLTEFSPREKFYSSLTEETVGEEGYTRAQQVLTEFHTSKMKEYHDLYLSFDVLLLADGSINFRQMGMEYYGPHDLHYYTLPGFTLDSCLKKTKQSLKLLTSPEHLFFFENSIGGGISVVSHRHAKANNPMVPNYNPDDVISWLLYVDANNLYGHAVLISGYSDFRFLTEDEMASFDLSNTNLYMEQVMFWKSIWTIIVNCMIFTVISLLPRRS